MADEFKQVGGTPTQQKRAYFAEYKGTRYLHIREWYEDKNDGTMKPSPKGITFKETDLQNLINALTELKDEEHARLIAEKAE